MLDRRRIALIRHGLDAKGVANARQSVDGGGEAFVAEHARVDAVGELAKLVDGPLQLGGGLVEAANSVRVGLWAQLRAQQPQPEQQADESLLCPVVEVALEPATLGVAGLDDPRPRSPQSLLLRPQVGL